MPELLPPNSRSSENVVGSAGAWRSSQPSRRGPPMAAKVDLPGTARAHYLRTQSQGESGLRAVEAREREVDESTQTTDPLLWRRASGSPPVRSSNTLVGTN